MSSPSAQATSSSGDSANDNPAAEVTAASASHRRLFAFAALGSSSDASTFPLSFPPSDAIRDDAVAGDPTSRATYEHITTASGMQLTYRPRRGEPGSPVRDVLVYSERYVSPFVEVVAQAPDDALWHVRLSSEGWLEVLKRPEDGTVRYVFGATPPVTLLRWSGRFEVAIKVVLRGGQGVAVNGAHEDGAGRE